MAGVDRLKEEVLCYFVPCPLFLSLLGKELEDVPLSQ